MLSRKHHIFWEMKVHPPHFDGSMEISGKRKFKQKHPVRGQAAYLNILFQLSVCRQSDCILMSFETKQVKRYVLPGIIH